MNTWSTADSEVTGQDRESLVCLQGPHIWQLVPLNTTSYLGHSGPSGQEITSVTPFIVFFISSCASTPERSLLLGDSADGQSIEITLRVIGGNTRKPMPLMGITHTRWSLNLNFLPSHSSSSFLPLLLTLLFPFSAYFSTLVVNGLKTIVIPRLRMEVRSKEAKKEGGGEGKR